MAHSIPKATASVNGLGMLAYTDYEGDVTVITGAGGVPLRVDSDGRIYERRGAILAEHELNADGMRELLAWSGYAGDLDVDGIYEDAGLDGFKIKKVLKKVKAVAQKVAVHKIVAKAVLGKEGEKKLSNVVKKATPYLMIAGAAVATIATAGAATPVLIGAVAAAGAQAAKDVAAKKQKDAQRDANKQAARDEAAFQAAQAAADAQFLKDQAEQDRLQAEYDQAQAAAVAAAQADAARGVPPQQATQPPADASEEYRQAYGNAYSQVYNASSPYGSGAARNVSYPAHYPHVVDAEYIDDDTMEPENTYDVDAEVYDDDGMVYEDEEPAEEYYDNGEYYDDE